ncbi:DUF1427 family protein [Burkholderia plantarii]|nr:DUF1427 family protein [Burkholderia plantarii]
MKSYWISLAAGALIGVIYSVPKVRSPAPPLVALAGLPGRLIGAWPVPALGPLTGRSFRADGTADAPPPACGS